MFWMISLLLEFTCPGDGTCSNQGTCNSSSGTCICNAGFEGNSCQGIYGLHEFVIVKLWWLLWNSNPKTSYVTFLPIIPEKLCPGGENPCSSHGQCDANTGLCSCEIGRHASDCSSESVINLISKLTFLNHFIFIRIKLSWWWHMFKSRNL